METFWKAAAVMLLTVILSITIGKIEKDMSVILTLTACCMLLAASIPYLSEVVSFLQRLSLQVDNSSPFTDRLLKITGIAFVTELSGWISADAGNNALGKAMQFLGNAVILFLSLPVFESFICIIQEILGIL